MVQDDRQAQMADGIHILGDSVQELALNYIEVLNRAERSGFTFKPKKVIVYPKNINLFGWAPHLSYHIRTSKRYEASHS